MPIPLASELPYTLHTNRELGLMLAGHKPLASFVDAKDCYPDALSRYLRLFDRQVQIGRIIRHDEFSSDEIVSGNILHRILFALPGETWRIQAMLELKRSKTWTKNEERREGELLGYDDWMNDYFLKLAYGS